MKTLLFVLAFTTLPVHAQESSAPAGDSSWSVLKELQEGNQRFVRGSLDHERQDPKTREQLAIGQKPKAIVLSCSDSRVPPETVFDQGLGDLFVVRIAGHALNPEAVASIEYAIEHLGARFLVVLGHDSCGAVKAAIAGPSDKHSRDLNQLVSEIRRNIAGYTNPDPNDKVFHEAVSANVRSTARELVQRSSVVQHAVEKQGLRIGQAVYSLETGKVEFIDVGRPWLVRVGAEKEAREPKKKEKKEKKEEKKTEEKRNSMYRNADAHSGADAH